MGQIKLYDNQKIFLIMKKNLFIFTGSRADYGILKNLVIDLKKEKNIIAKLVVGGSHFSKKYGYSIQEIIKDRIKVSHKISLKYKIHEILIL